MRYGDRFGANVHPDAADYRNRLDELTSKLLDMGVGWVRANGSNLAPLVAGNLNVQAVVHSVAEAQHALDSGVQAIELCNEPASGQIAAVKAVNDQIVAAVADRVRIVHTALAGNLTVSLASKLGATRGVHAGAVHGYRGNRAQTYWSAFVAQLATTTGVTAPHLPWMVTETGAHSYTGLEPNGKPATHKPTPPDVWAAQIIPDAVAWLAAGAERVFWYEAFDQPALGDTFEAHFGLLDTPAAAAVKAHLAQFGNCDDLTMLNMAPQVAALEQARPLAEQLVGVLS